MTTQPQPVILCILDGWGHTDETAHNAIALANTPHYDSLKASGACGLINASEHYVGLPKGQMGNSEVGHMNIGSGRPVRQLLPRINEAIDAGTFGDNAALQNYIAALKTSGGTCHLLGLCSDGGVHAHIDHIKTLATIIAANDIPVALHIITDGRDVAPTSARDSGFIDDMQALADAHDNITIATIGGRYYIMDRDNNWDRVEHAYQAAVSGIGLESATAADALKAAYGREETDEFIKPTVIGDFDGINMQQDGVLMANFRPDRAREIMQAFTMDAFDGFERPKGLIAHALGVADYWSEDCPLDVAAMFPLEKLQDTIGDVLSQHGKTQLRTAETEKFNHVTYFLSGANGQFEGETRKLVDSPKVATYDLQPEMSAPALTDGLVEAIKGGSYDFIAVNYANPDMVGHTGNQDAAIKAIEAVDSCLGRLKEAVDESNYVFIITADHGNSELMVDAKGNPHTQHTTNLVPFIVYHANAGKQPVRDGGALADIAPTILSIMQLPQPEMMTGTSLLASPAHARSA